MNKNEQKDSNSGECEKMVESVLVSWGSKRLLVMEFIDGCKITKAPEFFDDWDSGRDVPAIHEALASRINWICFTVCSFELLELTRWTWWMVALALALSLSLYPYLSDSLSISIPPISLSLSLFHSLSLFLFLSFFLRFDLFSFPLQRLAPRKPGMPCNFS